MSVRTKARYWKDLPSGYRLVVQQWSLKDGQRISRLELRDRAERPALSISTNITTGDLYGSAAFWSPAFEHGNTHSMLDSWCARRLLDELLSRIDFARYARRAASCEAAQ